MALNPPLLKLCDYANFALDDINEFAKGQGYAVSKFCLKTDKQNTGYTNRGRGRGRGSAQTLNRGGTSQISPGTASQTTAQSTQLT